MLEHPIVVTDHAPWYKYAFESLGLNYIQRTFGIRKVVSNVQAEEKEILQ